MTVQDFCYWLQGFFEIQNPKILTIEQINIIKDHLNLVLKQKEYENYDLNKLPTYYAPEDTLIC